MPYRDPPLLLCSVITKLIHHGPTRRNHFSEWLERLSTELPGIPPAAFLIACVYWDRAGLRHGMSSRSCLTYLVLLVIAVKWHTDFGRLSLRPFIPFALGMSAKELAEKEAEALRRLGYRLFVTTRELAHLLLAEEEGDTLTQDEVQFAAWQCFS